MSEPVIVKGRACTKAVEQQNEVEVQGLQEKDVPDRKDQSTDCGQKQKEVVACKKEYQKRKLAWGSGRN